MTRFLLREQLAARGVPFSNVHLLRLEKAGGFPRRVQITPGRVGWVESEVEDWLCARIAERDRTNEPAA